MIRDTDVSYCREECSRSVYSGSFDNCVSRCAETFDTTRARCHNQCRSLNQLWQKENTPAYESCFALCMVPLAINNPALHIAERSLDSSSEAHFVSSSNGGGIGLVSVGLALGVISIFALCFFALSNKRKISRARC